MKSVSDGLNDIRDSLRRLEFKINSKKDLDRVHKDNLFNRRFSVVLSDFSDFEAVGIRLQESIAEVENLNKEVGRRRKEQVSALIPEAEQVILKKVDKINRGLQADFKSLYIFGKVFLDKYTALIRFLFNWRGIGDASITHFFKDLDKYPGDDEQIIKFRNECLARLRAVDVFITQYRDKYIIHDQTGHKETRWFLNDMQGGIRFLGERPSVTPKDLLFVVSNYVNDTANFTEANM